MVPLVVEDLGQGRRGDHLLAKTVESGAIGLLDALDDEGVQHAELRGELAKKQLSPALDLTLLHTLLDTLLDTLLHTLLHTLLSKLFGDRHGDLSDGRGGDGLYQSLQGGVSLYIKNIAKDGVSVHSAMLCLQ